MRLTHSVLISHTLLRIIGNTLAFIANYKLITYILHFVYFYCNVLIQISILSSNAIIYQCALVCHFEGCMGNDMYHSYTMQSHSFWRHVSLIHGKLFGTSALCTVFVFYNEVFYHNIYSIYCFTVRELWYYETIESITKS